jgi:O-antigen/teichoic acid export membrane protein
MQLNGIADFFRNQTDRIVTASIAGTASLGTYYVADDIATAPTNEIVTPATRALFPVYATLLSDRAQLIRSYLDALSFMAVVAVSTSVGMALIAEDIVIVILGEKWLIAAPLVPWLALSGCVVALELSVHPVLGVTGYARMDALRNAAFVLLLAPAAITGGHYFGTEGIAAARLAIAVIFVPILFYSLMKVIPITTGQILERVWRPLVAAAGMAVAFRLFEIVDIPFALGRLLCEVAFGAAIFVLGLLILWLIAGRPSGAEEVCVIQLIRIFRHFRTRTARMWRLLRTGETTR